MANNFLRYPISNLEFPESCKSMVIETLNRNKVFTAAQLIDIGIDGLSNMYGMGEKKIASVREALAKKGLKLRGE